MRLLIAGTVVAFFGTASYAGAATPTPPPGTCGISERTQASGDASYEQALNYARHGDCALAAQTLGQASAHGSTVATNALAEMTESGSSGKADLIAAVTLYKQAAASGDSRAMYNLGRLVATGKVAPNQVSVEGAGASPKPSGVWGSNDVEAHSSGSDRYRDAAAFWEQSAAAGDPLAEYQLGTLYESGLGVPKDLARAIALYRAAAPFVPEAKAALQRLGAG
jgi:hypothetical protein